MTHPERVADYLEHIADAIEPVRQVSTKAWHKALERAGIMRRIDELHLRYPYYGARRIARQLSREGMEAGRLHVATLMRRMGIEARYRKPRTSIPSREGTIYPYLLEGVSIERPNQVWATDISYGTPRRCRSPPH